MRRKNCTWHRKVEYRLGIGLRGVKWEMQRHADSEGLTEVFHSRWHGAQCLWTVCSHDVQVLKGSGKGESQENGETEEIRADYHLKQIIIKKQKGMDVGKVVRILRC